MKVKNIEWLLVAGGLVLGACGQDEGGGGASGEAASQNAGGSASSPGLADAGTGGGWEDESWDEETYGGSASGGASGDWDDEGSAAGGSSAPGAADAGIWDEGSAGGAGGEGSGYEDEEPAPPMQTGEQYEDYGDNPFVATAEDRFSTFGIDVDTASYTIMRRDVTAGVLPTPEGVRVEEYVNFFPYTDAPPTAADPFPFAIHLDSAPSPFGEGLELLRVNLTGRELDVAQIQPANLIFLVDVSGSMQSPDKIGLVQYALSHLVEQLRPSDTIGIVQYAGEVGVALNPTPVEERGLILDAIAGMTAGGSTNGEGGIRAAYDLAARAFRQGGVNRVILCTDGDFNVGLEGDELYGLIEQERERGITLSALGFGAGNYNDAMMEQLADRGNGNYAYIDTEREADRVLERDLSGTLQVIAKDVKIQVELNPALVTEYRLVGYENRDVADQDFANDRVDGGEIGAGHQVTAYLELRLAEGVEPGVGENGVATVRVRAKAPDGMESRETSAELRVDGMGAALEETSDNFRFGAAVAEVAEVLRGSPHVAAEPEHLSRVLELALSATGEDADREEFVGLLRRIIELWPL